MNEQNNYQQPVEQNFQQPAPQYQQPAPQYQQPAPQYQQSYGPVRQLNTHRGLIKLILLTIITFGIYPLVFFSGISEDINLIASRFDGRKTMHYCLMAFIIGPLTLGIGFIVWFHNLSSRMGNELARRGIAYSFRCFGLLAMERSGKPYHYRTVCLSAQARKSVCASCRRL